MDEVRLAYGVMAARYIDLFADTAQVHDDDLELITRCVSLPTGTVLDVGCGPGHLTAYLRSLGVDAIGIDTVDEFIDHARSTHSDARFELGSIQHLPVRDGSVAGVLAWYSLVHMSPGDLDAALAELRRAMAAGGTLVAGFFDGDRVMTFDHKVVTAYSWPVDEFSERVRRAGFTVLERHRRPGIDEPGLRSHAAIVARAA